MENITWVSLGENCLTQEIINDLGVNCVVSPYSWALSTIDHILNLQEKELIVEDYFQALEPIYNEKYSVHKTSKNSNNSFFIETNKNLVFRHHDFISNSQDYEKIQRRMDRYKSLNNEDVVFLYYYRVSEIPNYQYVRSRLEFFISKYYPKAKALMFYPTNSDERSITLVQDKNNVFEFEVKTLIPYEGDFDLWKAKPDRDLHKEMLDYVSNQLV